jgi:CHAT domain-containing protein/Flp pilus assembly protein TadD
MGKLNIKSSVIGTFLLLLVLAPSIDRISAQAFDNLTIDRVTQTTGTDFLTKGIELYRTHQLKEAIKSWQQALNLFQKSQEDRGEMETLGALSAGSIELGDYDLAISYGERLVKIAQRLKNVKIQAQALGNLGIAYKNLGDYPKSIRVNQQALTISQELKMRPAEGQLLSNLGNTYAVIGNYDRAISVYKQSLEIARLVKNPQQEGNVLSNLGAVNTSKGEDREALPFYQDSLKIAKSIDDRSLEVGILINLGTTYYLLGEQKLGISKYQEAQVLAQKLENPQLLGDVSSNLGLIYEDRHEYATAIQLHQKSVKIAIASKNPRAEAIAHNNLAHTLLLTGKLADAQKNLRTAIQSLDRVRSSLNDLEQVNIFDTQVSTYNLLQQVLIADRQPEAALEVSEQGRARAFAQRLANRLYANIGDKPSSKSLALSTPSIEKIRQIAKQQNATLISYAIVSDKQFKFRGKQRGQEAELYIWVVQPNGKVTFRQADLKTLRQKNMTLAQLTNASRCLISSRRDCLNIEESVEKFTEGEYPGLQALYQLTIAPIADLLPQNPDDYVVFIPQDALFKIPFAALQSPDGKFLIEKHTIISAPSIQVLDFTHQQRQRQSNDRNRSAVVLGNPTMPMFAAEIGETPTQLKSLPHSEQEANEIAQLLHTDPKIGPGATKADFLKNLEQSRFVHLATHGFSDYTRAGLASTEVPGVLALAPTGKDDGLLTTKEIFSLKLNAKLVVLSACDTGRGRITGDGVMGLSRAWISAGVPSVIVSLRQVNDLPTRTLMNSFYHHFTKTSNVARSLRHAMLDTMKTDRTPVRWGAFMLIGEAESKY